MEPISTTKTRAERERQNFAKRWHALHICAQEIAVMAALSQEEISDEIARFPDQIRSIGGARWTLACETLGDIDAMLRPGLSALQAISSRGGDTTAPALVLWREFHAARSALMALAATTQAAEEPVAA